MGVSTKAVKRAVQHPDTISPGKTGTQCEVRVSGQLAVVYDPAENIVVTVLWAGQVGREMGPRLTRS